MSMTDSVDVDQPSSSRRKIAAHQYPKSAFVNRRAFNLHHDDDDYTPKKAKRSGPPSGVPAGKKKAKKAKQVAVSGVKEGEALEGPGPTLYTKEYKGQGFYVPEWVMKVVLAVAAGAKGGGRRIGAVGNLNAIMSQLVYWAEPQADGEPRAARKHRVQGRSGAWWFAKSVAALAKEVGLPVDQARTAVAKLVELGLVGRIVRLPNAVGGKYGLNTAYLRVRWEVVNPLVPQVMKPHRPKPSRKTKSEPED